MKNFRELKIWQKGLEIANNSLLIIKNFPKDIMWSLGQQIQRAAISIPSNIAEGGSRTSTKDYNRFIEISLGSAFELETQLLIARQGKLGDSGLIETTLQLLNEEQRMLEAFGAKLRATTH